MAAPQSRGGSDRAGRKGAYAFREVIDGGNDTLAVEVVRSVRGQRSGVEAEVQYWNVITFRDGRELRCEWFADRSDALEALRLRE